MGIDEDGDGTGYPVSTYQKPDVGKTYPKAAPVVNDEFDSNTLGLQWQWHANPQPYWGFSMGPQSIFRLYSVPLPEELRNYWDVPNLLMQKLMAPEFTATTKVTFTPRVEGEKMGFIVMGRDYSYISVENREGKLYISQTTCMNADKGGDEAQGKEKVINGNTFYLRVDVSEGGVCDFSFSENGKKFSSVGESFQAREGGWIGAKIGYFIVRNEQTNDGGNLDIDWFRVTE